MRIRHSTYLILYMQMDFDVLHPALADGHYLRTMQQKELINDAVVRISREFVNNEEGQLSFMPSLHVFLDLLCIEEVDISLNG